MRIEISKFTLGSTRWLLAVVCVSLILVAPGATAATSLVTDRSTLAGEDFVDWGTLGASFTTLANPFIATSNGGIDLTVEKLLAGDFEIRQQGTGWSGNFAPGDFLLWTSDYFSTSNPITVMDFDGMGVCAVGAQIQLDLFDSFVARIEGFDQDDVSMGFFDVEGVSSSSNDNSAIFIGIISDAPINSVAFSIPGSGYNFSSFAINQLDFTLCGLTKEIIGGNDIDQNGETDLVVEVGIESPATYDFILTYSGDDPVLIEDAVPAEWDAVIPENYYLNLSNGDFETGDFTGWNQINLLSGGIEIDDGTFDPPGPGVPVTPYDGNSAATWQTGPGTHTLWRDVDLPLGGARLDWVDHLENYGYLGYEDPNQEWRVEVWNPADDSVLAELFSTDPGDPTLQDWTERSADLTPWAGQTVRLAFTEQDNHGFFNARLDNVDIHIDTNMLDCSLRPANGKDNGKSATLAECLPEAGGMTIFSTIARCHSNRNNEKCKPTSCGALYLNDGAAAYEDWVFDAKRGFPEGIGDPVSVSNSLCLAAVYDVNGSGTIVYDGTGDEDGDSISDLAEACEIGTDPCLLDTDGDGLSDGEEFNDGICTDPLNPDSDGDGLSDGTGEAGAGTDPCDPDSDDDGYEDGADSCPMLGDEGNGVDAAGCPIRACQMTDAFGYTWNLLLEGDGTIATGSSMGGGSWAPEGGTVNGQFNPEATVLMTADNNAGDACATETDEFTYSGSCSAGGCSGTWESFCDGIGSVNTGTWSGSTTGICELSNPDAAPIATVSAKAQRRVRDTGGTPTTVN